MYNRLLLSSAGTMKTSLPVAVTAPRWMMNGFWLFWPVKYGLSFRMILISQEPIVLSLVPPDATPPRPRAARRESTPPTRWWEGVGTALTTTAELWPNRSAGTGMVNGPAPVGTPLVTTTSALAPVSIWMRVPLAMDKAVEMVVAPTASELD